MEIVKSWIIDYAMLVLLSDGTYRIGTTTNVFGFQELENDIAEKMIETGKIDKTSKI